MEKNEFRVNGIQFSSYAQAQEAQKELECIVTIKEQLDMENKNAVYQIYEKMIERDFFKSVVGYHFLLELRHLLVTDFGYNEEELSMIKVPKLQMDKNQEQKRLNLEQQVENLTLIKKKMSIVIAALLCMVVAMFVIAALNPNAGYINAENKVLNKYSAWQEDLEQREQAIKLKEKELGIDRED